jgi:hypothetical protein
MSIDFMKGVWGFKNFLVLVVGFRIRQRALLRDIWDCVVHWWRIVLDWQWQATYELIWCTARSAVPCEWSQGGANDLRGAVSGRGCSVALRHLSSFSRRFQKRPTTLILSFLPGLYPSTHFKYFFGDEFEFLKFQEVKNCGELSALDWLWLVGLCLNPV